MNTEVTTQEVKPTVLEGSATFSFNFRTEKIRNEQGEVIAEGKKVPPVSVILPVPSNIDLINMLGAGGLEARYLSEVVYEAIKAAGRGQINEFIEANPDKPVTADVLDLSKLTFSAIANTPKESRAKPEIPEEVKNTFYEDYKAVIVASGKELKRALNHIIHFKSEFRALKYDRPSLNALRDNLNVWAAKTENMNDNTEVFEFLMTKVDKYLAAEPKNLVASL